MSWEETLISAVRVLDVFGRIDMTRRIDRVRVDTALQTLRQIFFYSSELIAALKDIQNGKRVEPEVVEYFAEEFRHPPQHIQEALSFIEHERFEESNALLIDDLDLMRQIRYGKLDVRREISRFFGAYEEKLERNEQRLGLEAARVLGQIERLNSAIQELELRLRNARLESADTPASRPSRSRTKR